MGSPLIAKIVIYVALSLGIAISSAAAGIECEGASNKVLRFDLAECPFGLMPKVDRTAQPPAPRSPSASSAPRAQHRATAPPPTQNRQPDQLSPRDRTASTTSIPLLREGGTYKVPVLINGIIPLHFTVDSGAADVSVPADVVMTLVRTGTITDADFMGEQTYVLADGSRIKSRRFRIRQIKIGNITIENVTGSVGGVQSSLLLGQSFLERFNKVSFDYRAGVLVLE